MGMTIIEMFEQSVSKYEDEVLLLEKEDGAYRGTTYKEVLENVKRFSAGLVALGLREGDRIALLSEGRNDWLISELAILYSHAINVPLSFKLEADADLKWRLEHSGARFIIVSAVQLPKIRRLKNKLPLLERIIILDKTDIYEDKEIPKEDVYGKGDIFLHKNVSLLEERKAKIRPDDIANIAYTSGTSADPKGVMLTHKNYTSNVIQASSLTRIGEQQRNLAILPWDHAFAHTVCLYTFIYFGGVIAAPQLAANQREALRNIPKNILEVKPDIMMCVPALAKNFRRNIETAIRKKGRFILFLFRKCLHASYIYNGLGCDRGKGLRILLKPLHFLYDAIFYKKVREAFGGELQFFIGGGALLDIELQRFFYAVGLPLMQGYGLTEASPIISCNIYEPGKHKLGSCGRVARGIELRILDNQGKELPAGEKGEIVIKGDNVMQGYWNNPVATEAVLRNGWLYTGDLGYRDQDGFLYVLGRFKSLLIGNDGEKYSPEGIEEAVVEHSFYIEQCMLHNNQDPHTMMLIVPNAQALVRTLARKSKTNRYEEEYYKEAIQLIYDSFDTLKKGVLAEQFSPRWFPSVLVITGETFNDCNQCINSTMKMVRDKIEENFKKEMLFAYDPHAKNMFNSMNMQNIKRLLDRKY
jgi:long-chain acyl-CoA synthetase